MGCAWRPGRDRSQEVCSAPVRTRYAGTETDGSSRQLPDARSKRCLSRGEATNGRPSAEPVRPRESTWAPVNGSRLAIA